MGGPSFSIFFTSPSSFPPSSPPSLFIFPVYVRDEEIVPKDSSVIFRRLPMRNNTGLVARLKGGRSAAVMPAYCAQQQQSEIILPMRSRDEPQVQARKEDRKEEAPAVAEEAASSSSSSAAPAEPTIIHGASFEQEDEEELAGFENLTRGDPRYISITSFSISRCAACRGASEAWAKRSKAVESVYLYRLHETIAPMRVWAV